ncbi:nucleoporin GLE1-like protein isoform X2 [Wolffia australiana]
MGFIELKPPVAKNPALCGRLSLEPDPCWTLDSLISELNSVSIKGMLPPSSSPLSSAMQFRDEGKNKKRNAVHHGKAFVICITDEDIDDYHEEGEEIYMKSSRAGTRFSCPDSDFSDSEASEGELYLEQSPIALMDKTNLTESLLKELEREHQQRIKEEIRKKAFALEAELKGENCRSLSAITQLDKLTEIRREMDRRMDKQYQRKIAEAFDSHLSRIQRDHEQRSQIEERRIKDDAALEELKKREKALQEARLHQAKVEAEAKQEAARQEEERQKAALEAERLAKSVAKREEDEKVVKVPPAEATEKKQEKQPEGDVPSTLSDFIVKVADSAKQAAVERITKHDNGLELYNKLLYSGDKDFDKYQRQIGRQIRQLTATVESVRTKSTELSKVLRDSRCPYPVSLMIFAKKLLDLCENPGASFDGIAFAVGHIIVRVTANVPETLDYLLAEFHKSCMFTVPQFVQYSKGMNRAKEYWKLIGYREEEDKMESTDSYLDRVESYMKLYGALVQTDAGNVPNPHGLREGWAWLARFLNTLPVTRSTAVALEAFLKMAGFALFKRYRGQFVKLINTINQRFMPALRRSQSDPDVHRIISKLEAYLNHRQYLTEPPGHRLETSLSSRVHMA